MGADIQFIIAGGAIHFAQKADARQFADYNLSSGIDQAAYQQMRAQGATFTISDANMINPGGDTDVTRKSP